MPGPGRGEESLELGGSQAAELPGAGGLPPAAAPDAWEVADPRAVVDLGGAAGHPPASDGPLPFMPESYGTDTDPVNIEPLPPLAPTPLRPAPPRRQPPRQPPPATSPTLDIPSATWPPEDTPFPPPAPGRRRRSRLNCRRPRWTAGRSCRSSRASPKLVPARPDATRVIRLGPAAADRAVPPAHGAARLAGLPADRRPGPRRPRAAGRRRGTPRRPATPPRSSRSPGNRPTGGSRSSTTSTG